MLSNLKISFQIVVIIFFVTTSSVGEERSSRVKIGSFTDGSLTHWKSKEFKGQTHYRLVKVDGLQVLEAESNAAASGLFLDRIIDLQKTPVLNWQWRVEKPLSNANEQKKAGDDFVARIYIIVSGGLAFWQTKSINYVWASATAKDKIWSNPFAGDFVKMVAVRSSTDKIGVWYSEKRNIRDDFKNLMGEEIQYIDAVAIMTDTDNAMGNAKVYYGDIYFTTD